MSIAAQKHHGCPTCRCGDPLPDSVVQAMTDPTPTRAISEMEAYVIQEARAGMGMDLEVADVKALAASIQALRERAETAERAEAAAWNDAIKAVRKALSVENGSRADYALRALRRAAPTEGEA